MKMARFDGGKTGLVVERNGLRVLDVMGSIERLRELDAGAAKAIERVLPSGRWQGWSDMIRRWDEVRGAFQTLNGLGEDDRDLGLVTHALESVTLEAPLATPAVHIFAIASNTTVHIINAMKALLDLNLTEQDVLKAKNGGLPPLGFTVWASTVTGTGATVAPPRGTQKFDYEGECAVYVKTGGRYLDTVDLWGYAAFNDFGVRDTHFKLAKEAGSGPFSFNTPKNFDTGKACGPWVVVDETGKLGSLRCVVRVNGSVRQNWVLSDMIYSFNETLSFLSQGLTLGPGDMLASGTGAGVAVEGGLSSPHWLKAGDIVEVTLDGAGTLRNTIGHW